MARTSNTSTGKTSTRTRKTGATKTTKVVEPVVAQEAVETVETAIVPEVAADTVPEITEPVQRKAKPVYRVKNEIDPNMYVSVRNGFNGKLVYKSRKSGERYVWDKFGDEQDMELRELRAAKTSYKSFFENNWFMIDDPEIIAYLGVERYYKNALSYSDFDSLFEMSPSDIEKKISLLSNGQKSSVAYRARQLIREGGIDSIKVINTLEKSLGIELIER